MGQLFRTFSSKATGDHLQFCLRRCLGSVRCQPAEHVEVGAQLRYDRGALVNAERTPVVTADGNGVARRHDADDGVRGASDVDFAPNVRRVTAETRLPDVVSDLDHVRSAEPFVLVEKRAAKEWTNPRDAET